MLEEQKFLPYITYEFVIDGGVPEAMLQTFPGIEPERQDDRTVLRVVLAGPGALQSILAVIDLFGLSLLGVRRVSQRLSPPSAS